MRETQDLPIFKITAEWNRVVIGDHLVIWVFDDRFAPLDSPLLRPKIGSVYHQGWPCYRLTSDYQSGHFLRADAHQWLMERGSEYRIHPEFRHDMTEFWTLYIDNRDVAMLFKLTWGCDV